MAWFTRRLKRRFMSQKGEGISKLKNLGPKSEKWLNEIGIYSISDIKRIGSVEIYRLLKQNGVAASLNLVYALEGAIIGEH